MIELHLSDCLGLAARGKPWRYEVGSVHLASDIALGLLEPFSACSPAADSPPPEPAPDPVAAAAEADGDSRTVHGWLAGETRTIRSQSLNGGLSLEISGIGRIEVSANGNLVRCRSLLPGVSRSQLEEVLLGPPLSLALAGHEVWCLHASAVARHGRAVLFLGDSGRGKSTLARHCGEQEGIRRVGDDILPCALTQGEAVALPWFPQPKLGPTAQFTDPAGRGLPLAKLIFLAPDSAVGSPSLEGVSPIQAIKLLTQQSVSLSLFGPALRRRHLQFVSGVAARTPAYLLHYAHDYGRLDDLCGFVQAQLDGT